MLMKRFIKKILWVSLLACFMLGLGLIIYLLQTEVIEATLDPSGTYRVETSARRLDRILPRMPGQASDLPVFVEIFDQNNRSLGRMHVPMWQMAGVQFTEDGAFIPLIGRWNFKQRSCIYQNEQGQDKSCT